jgi:hypothetical protein
MTVRGTVGDGVEPGCRILTAEGVVYLLLGPGSRDLPEGAEVTVEGMLRPGLMTTCQQGTPLVIERIVALGR